MLNLFYHSLNTLKMFKAKKEEAFPSIRKTLLYLKDLGFNPSIAIDVGAYHGEWTKLFKNIYPQSKVLMIEAQEQKERILKEVCKFYDLEDISLEIALLGSENNKEVCFCEMETGSSVFEESSPYRRDYVTKTLVTLDTLVSKYKEFQNIDFLKLDVQGYELEVLAGATTLLKKTEFILLEASLIPVNQGCPLIEEVIYFMTKRNFRMLDFCSQIRRKDGLLWQTDILFIRNDSQFLPNAYIDSSNWF
jgi:FkbM family methyltransferase